MGILVVSRDTKYCGKAVHYGVSLSRKYGAELYVIHVVHAAIRTVTGAGFAMAFTAVSGRLLGLVTVG